MGYGRRSERYPADFIKNEVDVPVHPIGAVPAVDRLLSLRLPARREYITAAEYNALIDAIVEAIG